MNHWIDKPIAVAHIKGQNEGRAQNMQEINGFTTYKNRNESH